MINFKAIEYKLYSFKCHIQSIYNQIDKVISKDKYKTYYIMFIPSVHCRDKDMFLEWTVLFSKEQRDRIHEICREKDCYIMEQKTTVTKEEFNRFRKYTMSAEEYVGYFMLLDRLESVKPR